MSTLLKYHLLLLLLKLDLLVNEKLLKLVLSHIHWQSKLQVVGLASKDIWIEGQIINVDVCSP